MDGLTAILNLFLGLILRIGIPVAFTIGFIWMLNRLDNHWQADAEQEAVRVMNGKRAPAKNVGCWKINGCPQEKVAKCPAHAHPETPCWQVFRESNGPLRETCLGCKVFKEAPIPVVS